MATKGQKFKKHSDNVKTEILKKIKNGVPHKLLSEQYNISKGTIDTWAHKMKKPELYPNQGQKRGRPKEKNLTLEDYKERYEILKKYQAFLKAQREKK